MRRVYLGVGNFVGINAKDIFTVFGDHVRFPANTSGDLLKSSYITYQSLQTTSSVKVHLKSITYFEDILNYMKITSYMLVSISSHVW